MDSRSYKTVSANRTNVDKKWVLVDVEGKTLGRACSQIASMLRGKHKPNFTPHVDCGDNVVVINADKIRLSGNKWDKKTYIHHTGYPGGQRSIVAKDLMVKHPIRMVENAVKGMLPKSRLGRQMYRNLKVYAGAEHKHGAQEPTTVELK